MENELKLKVTRMHKLEGSANIKAFADIAVNDSLLLKGIRVVSGKNGIFVSMPREKGKDGKWYETIHPVTKFARDKISSVVVSAFNEGA